MKKTYDKIRVGFIGTGRISDLHALEYIRDPKAEIVALCDQSPETAKGRASAWRLESPFITDDMQQLLKRPDIDLVEILLPHHLHKSAALAAINAGKAVSLQKPMCLNVAEADEVIDAAHQAGVPFKVFENFIFYPPVMKAKELIDQGAIGEPLTIRIKSNPGKSKTMWDIPASAAAWRQQSSHAGGGPLVFDDGHHKFALAWHFMGPAEEVHSWISHTTAADGFVFDAPAIISFKFPGNRYGNLEIVYSPDLLIETKHYAQDDRVEITGTKGIIWINQGHGKLGETPPVQLYSDGIMTAYTLMDTGWEWSFIHSTRYHLKALREGLPFKLTGEEGREILHFASAAEKSAKLGRAVQL
jgi:predicted dehydrogenase